MSGLCASRLHFRTAAPVCVPVWPTPAPCPPHLFELSSDLGWQPFVNRHQVVGLPPGLRKASLQELIERGQVLQPPVLSSPYFTQVLAEFNKLRVAVVLVPGFP